MRSQSPPQAPACLAEMRDKSDTEQLARAELALKMKLMEAIEALETARIPVGHIYKPAETLQDPHVVEAGFLKPVEYPGMKGTAPVADLHVKLSKTPGGVRRRPPARCRRRSAYSLGAVFGDSYTL